MGSAIFMGVEAVCSIIRMDSPIALAGGPIDRTHYFAMPIRKESEMIPPARDWLHSQGLLAKPEVPNPWGICDLVGCRLDKERVGQRLELGQIHPIGTSLRVSILGRIPDRAHRRSTSFQDLSTSFGGAIKDSTLRAQLEELLARRFVQKTRTGRFQKLNGWMPLQQRLVAVELKLHKVEAVIRQALDNLQLTYESYVALEASVAERVMADTRGERFRKLGVGLLSVGENGCHCLAPAPARAKQSVDQVAQQHCVERFWVQHLKGS